jgi:hypothetical protein
MRSEVGDGQSDQIICVQTKDARKRCEEVSNGLAGNEWMTRGYEVRSKVDSKTIQTSPGKIERVVCVAEEICMEPCCTSDDVMETS